MIQNNRLAEQIGAWYNCWFRLRGVYQAWAEKNGLTYNTLFTLYEIDKHVDGCTQKQLCDYLMLSKQTVSAILKKLEQSGYIIRKSGVGDRRKNQVTFTPTGKAYAQPILAGLKQMELDGYGMLSEEALDEIVAVATNLADSLEKSGGII